MRFAGAVAVVTGASRGIGRATAGLLAAEGATVVAAARNGNRLEELAGEASGTVQPVACDVAVPTDVARLFRVAADAGGCSILVTAAGVLFKRPIEGQGFTGSCDGRRAGHPARPRCGQVAA